ncbi:MAG: heptosyltransferase [Arcobacter sp.]|nr:MAG: heptosyltransferase [Arcobacter sp.]
MKNIKKILIIRCGALGDLVYSTSVIDALILQFGSETIIDYVCTPGTVTLFEKDSRVRHVFPLKHRKLPIFLSKQKKKIINFSKEYPYDIMINFEKGNQFKSLLQNIISKQKIGRYFSTIIYPLNMTHVVERTKEVYKDIIDIENFNKSFPRLIGSSIENVKSKYSLPNKYIIISPSNSHQKRNIINYRAWDNEKWIELIEKLSKKCPVVIIGNKTEDNFFNKLKPYPLNVIDLVGKTSLVDLVGVINGSHSLISTDTGTAHIASAVNTEVFALIGPTPADVTGPYKTVSNKVNIISENLECSPCYKTKIMKECKDNLCMKNIKVSRVYSLLINSLERK